MTKYLVFTIFLLSFTCEVEHPIPAGLETNVSGKVLNYDNTPVANAKILIAEYKSDLGNLTLVRYVDSTVTNLNGEYKMKFKTSGGTRYYLAIDNYNGDYTYYYNYGYDINDPNDLVEIGNIGNNFVYNFFVTKLYPCDVTINTSGIKHFPIYVYQDAFLKETEITSNTSIVKRIYIDGIQSEEQLIFSRNGGLESAVINFPVIYSNGLFKQNITIHETDFL